ncbi:MAG: hypothetical protein ACR2NZ_10305 [Rubripirellula sp.]
MDFHDQCARWTLLWFLLLMAQTGCESADGPDTEVEDSADPSGVVDVVMLREKALTESSGLAISLRKPGHFWTHNDSGSKACLFAFDSDGNRTAVRKIKSVKANDWEDLCGYDDGGVSRLLIADCGDNDRQRDSIDLHFIAEPDPTKSDSISSVHTMEVRYPDGARDCEAVAVDTVRRKIVLVTKSILPNCGVYVVPLPTWNDLPTHSNVTAKRMGSLPLPMVTAMDIDPVSGDVWLVSYFQAFQFRAEDRESSLAVQMAQLPIAHELPRWRQIEAVAIDANQDVWVTSEGNPAPLGRLPQSSRTESDTQPNKRPS